MNALARVVWHGHPTVKKNKQVPVLVGGRPRIFPSGAYKAALRSALKELTVQSWPEGLGSKALPVRVQASFYLGPRQRPDLDGLITACADILEAAGIVANDYWITSWDGSRRLRDIEDPRTEVLIEAA